MVSSKALKSSDIPVRRTTAPKPKPPEATLGFGRFFSDHMFLYDYNAKDGWHSARITPYEPLPLDPGASVLHYGQALFEGMKAFRGEGGKIRLFRPEMNWARLVQGCERLCMKAPPKEDFLEALKAYTRVEADWVPRSEGTALYLRPTLIGTEGFLGVRPSENYLFYIIGSPVGGYYQPTEKEPKGQDTVKIWVEREYSRCAPGGIGAVKAGGNYAASLLAATEAKKKGFAQVLWLDAGQKKYVEEVGTMNVFFRIGDRIVTPKLAGTILPGVMRDSGIQLLKRMGLTVEERLVELEEVLAAHAAGTLKEVFGTGTAASVSPVGALGVDGKLLTIGTGHPGEIATQLYKDLTDIQYGRKPDTLGWITEL